MRVQACLIVSLAMACSAAMGCNHERRNSRSARDSVEHHAKVVSEEAVPAPKPTDSTTQLAQAAPPKSDSPAPAAAKPDAETKPGGAPAPAHPAMMDAQNNPTAASRRGEPSLDDKDRPAVWVYVDGKGGNFVEKNGQRLLQWMISSIVSEKPTFRVEAYAPLLGTPSDFKCVLKTVESNDGSYIDYRIAAKEGTFSVGRDYRLLKPGDDFTIRNAMTGDVVKEIGPLHPGTYALAVSVRNGQTGKEGSGVSYFAVAPTP